MHTTTLDDFNQRICECCYRSGVGEAGHLLLQLALRIATEKSLPPPKSESQALSWALQGGLTQLPSLQPLRDPAHQQSPGSCFSLLFPIHWAWAAGTQASTPLHTHAWTQKDLSVSPQQITWSPPGQRLKGCAPLTEQEKGKRKENRTHLKKKKIRRKRKWKMGK